MIFQRETKGNKNSEVKATFKGLSSRQKVSSTKTDFYSSTSSVTPRLSEFLERRMRIIRNISSVKFVIWLFLQGVRSDLKRYELLTVNMNLDQLTPALVTGTKPSLVACIFYCETTPDCRYLYYSQTSEECILHSKRKSIMKAINLWRLACPRGDYRYDDNTGTCVKIYTTPTTWQDASDLCNADAGHLVTMDTSQEYNNAVFKALTAWVGARDDETEGVFRWLVTDEDVLPQLNAPWGTNQPDGGLTEQCLSLVIKTSSSTGQKLNKRRSAITGTTTKLYDDVCTTPLAFICEL